MKTFYAKSSGGFYAGDHPSIPNDAVEISSDVHKEMLHGQTLGKVIMADENGFPVLQDPPEKTAEELAIVAREKRDKLIAETDFMVMPDYPLTKSALTKVKTYRQSLRDITKQPSFPSEIIWPEKPVV
jgi:hypothetical protein